MNKMRRNKLFKLWIAASVVISASIPYSAVSVQAQSSQTAMFKDVASNHWARGSIDWGVKQGIVTGDDKGNFNANKAVSEPEFLAMLVRAYPDELKVRQAVSGEKWYSPYFDLATDYYLQINGSNEIYQRYQVANVVYTLLKDSYKTDEQSIQFLLDTSLSAGKVSATVEGYLPYEQLTRAEAITFIQRVKELYPTVKQTLGKSIAYSKGLRDIEIGDTEATLINKLGQPNRKDPSEQQYTWYVYNNNYNQFAMYGISSDKKVVALYSNARNVWGNANSVLVGHSNEKLSKGASSLVRSDYGYYQLKSNELITNYYVDSLNDNTVEGIFQYSPSYAGKNTTSTQQAIDAGMDKQILDVTNVFRNKNGLKTPLIWNEQAAKVAFGHSKDMYTNKYMDHTNKKGLGPRERLVAAGFKNFGNGENVAYGYENAFSVHSGWVNSKGHRENILYASFKELGVGTHNKYYTQNFIVYY